MILQNIRWKEILSIKYNVWLVMGATLLAVWLTGIILNAQGQALFSLASGLARVTLIDAQGAAYPDEITVQPGAIIYVGWNGHLAKPCTSSGWTQITDKNVRPVQVGPINQDETLSVTCTSGRGQVSDSLKVHISNSSTSLVVTSPVKDEKWHVGQGNNIISWTMAASGAHHVIISLNHPEQTCLHTEPRCLPVQTAPYPILDNASMTSNTYAWSVPADFPAAFIGDVQITVVVDDQQASSETFQILGSSTPPAGPVISVISPNGGEIWNKRGMTATPPVITWTASSTIAKVNIDLVDYISCDGKICPARPIASRRIATVDANSRSFSFTKFSSIPNGQYKVVISAVDGSISDDSDGPFTIQDEPSSGSGDRVPLNQEFSLKKGQSIDVFTPAKLFRVTYTDFFPVACTAGLNQSCTYDITVTVDGQNYIFHSVNYSVNQSVEITSNFHLRLLKINAGGSAIVLKGE